MDQLVNQRLDIANDNRDLARTLALESARQIGIYSAEGLQQSTRAISDMARRQPQKLRKVNSIFSEAPTAESLFEQPAKSIFEQKQKRDTKIYNIKLKYSKNKQMPIRKRQYGRRRPNRSKRTTYQRKTYSRRGVTAQLVKQIIHSENEKKTVESLESTNDWSSVKFLDAGFQVPYTINYYNLLLTIPTSGLNSREGTKIFIKTLYYRINIRSIYTANSYNASNLPFTKPCVRCITAIPRKAVTDVYQAAAPFLPSSMPQPLRVNTPLMQQTDFRDWKILADKTINMTAGGVMPDHYFEGSVQVNMHYDYGTNPSQNLNDTGIFNKIPWMFIYCENPTVNNQPVYEISSFTKLFFTDS